jgi:hypothetical protein
MQFNNPTSKKTENKQTIMKTTIRTLWNSLVIIFLGTLMAGQAHGQIFLTNRPGSGATIGEYDATTGAAINASLVSGLNDPIGIAASGGNLYVAEYQSGTIGEYNATTGATVNASLVSGLTNPVYIAVSGGNLFVTNQGAGTIGEYNATTGATVNASLVSGLNSPGGIAVSGGNLFVTNQGAGTIGEYDATTGAAINASLVSGLNYPDGIAVSGGNLFVVNQTANTIGEYNATTGATVNASFVSGLDTPLGIAVSGGNLYVTNCDGSSNGSGTVGEYNATTGATVNASLVSGLSCPYGIAVVAPTPACQFATSIASNFNGTQINGGNYLWFNGVLKPSGLGSNPVTIRFTQQTITSANFTLSVPDATVTFDPSVNFATTTFSGGMWVTTVPSGGLAGNTFFSALGYLVPANLPGGIHNVTWSGTISTDTPGVSVQWKWGAAVYTNFNADYTALGVKPVDDNKKNPYLNADHAGTPENFKPYVIGGATGGGGSNYTGGLSGTAAVGPCQP